MSKQSAYDQLIERSKHWKCLESISALLEWDQETVMPPAGSDYRGEQKAALAEEIYKLKASKEVGALLKDLFDAKRGVTDEITNPDQRVIVERIAQDYDELIKLPIELVKKKSSLTSHAVSKWAQAKKEGKFSIFAPQLKELFDLAREEAEHLGYEKSPYDALLNQYDHGLTSEKVAALFNPLRESLSPFIETLSARECPLIDFGPNSFSEPEQIKLCKELLQKMGLCPTRHNFHTTNHPFCLSICPNDVRPTSHFLTDNLLGGVLAACHEGGHALYEANLNTKFRGTPLCEFASLSIHESQSLFWENCIGTSRPFWEHLYPQLKEQFKTPFEAISLDQFYAHIVKVCPSTIRIYADRVTYPLHIVLRFELEKMLIEKEIETEDLPALWDEKMQSYLGITPPNISEGVLQDIHWSAGLIGYFPTYTLGLLYATQLFDTFTRKFPDWETQVAAGNWAFINEWLKETIHTHGRRFDSDALITHATGTAPSANYYLNYIKTHYNL
ncbi:MAG: Carboxypeptidase 1 [Chlamydiia bacterium]|nr:Carboxypeptidase 1 [Chlamydiia bacterium]